MDEYLYQRILYDCFPAEEMRVHLKQFQMDGRQIKRLICSAPLSLEAKADYFEELSDPINFRELKDDGLPTFQELREMAWEGINLLAHKEEGAVLRVYFHCTNECFDERLYSSYDAVIEMMKRWRTEGPDEDLDHDLSISYFSVELYSPEESKPMSPSAYYDFHKGQPAYYWNSPTDPPSFYRSRQSDCRPLPHPFRTGDIITFDRFPYQKAQPALVLDPCDPDGRMIVLLYDRFHTWSFRIINLKHFGYLFTNSRSPIYTLGFYRDKLKQREEFLLTVRDWLKENLVTARKFIEAVDKLDAPGVDECSLRSYMMDIMMETQNGHS